MRARRAAPRMVRLAPCRRRCIEPAHSERAAFASFSHPPEPRLKGRPSRVWDQPQGWQDGTSLPLTGSGSDENVEIAAIGASWAALRHATQPFFVAYPCTVARSFRGRMRAFSNPRRSFRAHSMRTRRAGHDWRASRDRAWRLWDFDSRPKAIRWCVVRTSLAFVTCFGYSYATLWAY